uniref:Myozenin 3 n=1 Tax=Rhinolophus ferrumequinum TaxID=59479 RepID=A0A671F2C0_RHIFE
PVPQGSLWPLPTVPLLDLGKKLSVPQDLMMEELSLRKQQEDPPLPEEATPRAEIHLELAASQRAREGLAARRQQARPCPGCQRPGGELRLPLHTFHTSPGVPEDAQPAASQAERVRSASALAPGYAEPLKSVPPEKFNHTVIPKGYRSPWQDFISYRDYQSDGRSHTPRPPVPFGGALVGETMPRAGTPFVPELISGLELLRLRPNFNRVAQGWVRNLPESEEL